MAVLFLMLFPGALTATAGGLPFIQDDYPQALREAKGQHRAIFVEVWAPW